MNPVLKAPGFSDLELKCDELLSSFAFNFNLRCYTQELGRRVETLINLVEKENEDLEESDRASKRKSGGGGGGSGGGVAASGAPAAKRGKK